MEFDEEFGGVPAEGGGDDSMNTSATATKTPKPKREKKEPGKILTRSQLTLIVYTNWALNIFLTHSEKGNIPQ